jgi:glycosyltransferase involved in cell wall biosynthesis
MMRKYDLFFFPSIMEATSTVVLEAIGNQLPIICFNTCGFGSIVKEGAGIAIELSTPRQSIKDFSREITRLYEDRNLLQSFSQACIPLQQELSWDSKARKMVAIYEQLLS